MSASWNVQPYRWLGELKAQYAAMTIATTNKAAQQLAPEAEQWMKQNAPWQDRTPAERKKKFDKEGGYVHPEALAGARAGLRVIIDMDEKAEKAYEENLKIAKGKDKRAQIQLKKQSIATGKPERTLPKSSSAVGALNKEIASLRLPIVNVYFRHSRNIYYAIWLEIARGGRYSILAPALDYWGPRLMNRIVSLSNLVQYQSLSFGDITTPEEAFAEHVATRSQEPGGYEPWNESFRQKRKQGRIYEGNRPDVEGDIYGALPSREDEERLDAYYRKYGR